MLKTLFVSVVIAVIFMCAGFVYSQEDGITLESGFGNATFNHSTHSDYNCTECHHVGESDQKCTDCHTEDADVDTKTAFHDNCVTCHQNEGTGPTGCAECHEKE